MAKTYAEAVAAAAKLAAVEQITVAMMPAKTADDIGGLVLQAIARQLGLPLLAEAGSKYHSEKLFRP